MFEKKFKVRVCHYHKKYFHVEYAYYRFFPNYQTILHWDNHYSYESNLERWSPQLFCSKGAENFAEQFKSIEDIRKYYEKEELKRIDYYKRKKEYIQKTIPYKTKQIL